MANNPEADTTALDGSFLETFTIHNREYQQYSIENLVYFVPVDDDEIERLLAMHNVLTRVFDNRLIFPPLPRPRRILDCGHGSASWAIEVAAEHPRCEVIGLDINPWQPAEVPNNLYLQVDDLNSSLTFPSHNFDLVHSQMVANGIHINRWTHYIRDMFRVTRPGGWCQMVELYYNVQSDNGSLTEGHALRQWSSRYLESHEGLKDLRVPLRLPALMREAGFVDVEHQMIPLHTCAWSSGMSLKPIFLMSELTLCRSASERNWCSTPRRRTKLPLVYGHLSFHRTTWVSIHCISPALALILFFRMTIQDVHLLVAQARIEADNPAFKVGQSYASLCRTSLTE
ncbi:S-adenosyl-L-methionine-dependent methyltransferase [Halenospora varia]|nr:S-adenosyl-L-methionine-dependent methyltransferase [Halenospora varia]